jgi:hypothetical protein
MSFYLGVGDGWVDPYIQYYSYGEVLICSFKLICICLGIMPMCALALVSLQSKFN